MVRPKDLQGTLFELPPHHIRPAESRPELAELAERLPPLLHLGGMSWTYPGWLGSVYGAAASEKQLAAHGLPAYAKHPLLRSVEIDRSYYEPLSADALTAYADQVPGDFRFVVKAHEDCTVVRFPQHTRYGKKRGLDNPRFLDAEYAERAVVEPVERGLGDKLGAILFQFSPQDVGGPVAFVRRLHTFLSRLPKGIAYAVELRNAELFTRDYGAALADAGAVHCHNVWTGMPTVLAQARLIPPAARKPLLVRWLLRQDDRYQEAMARFQPFHKLQQADPDNRAQVADLVAKALRHDVPVTVLVDNKAEGCAPESIVELARTVDAARTANDPK
ncbi:MAG: hypothetical protein RLZZ450_3871 [Pseudomonadota bacterium]|jgi:uncharacterized protein YecE (DUF72 family)